MNADGTIERGDRVTVDGMDGIVYWFACMEHAMNEDGELEPTGMALVVMVGDDQRYRVHPEDLAPLPEDEHVCSCGQRGCPHE